MSKIKISYRGPIIWNVIVFILFSLFFLFLQNAFLASASVLNHDALVSFVESKKYLFFIYGLALIFAYKIHRTTKLFFWVSVAFTVGETLNILLGEFSKFIVILLFFYLLFSYFLYQFFTQEQQESYYNPLFDSKDLFQPMCKKIKVTLWKGDKEVAKGHLTNWSETGFFVFLQEPLVIKGLLKVEVHLEGESFFTDAQIVSRLSGGTGFGFRAKASRNSSEFNWVEFFSIIKNMGYEPRLLR